MGELEFDRLVWGWRREAGSERLDSRDARPVTCRYLSDFLSLCLLVNSRMPSLTACLCGYSGETQVSSWLMNWTELTYSKSTQFVGHARERRASETTPCSVKWETPYSCWYLCQTLTDFHNYFTGWFCSKVAVKRLLRITSHFAYVATLPCETFMFQNKRLTTHCKVA